VLIETFIRKQLGLKARQVTRVEQGETVWVVHTLNCAVFPGSSAYGSALC